MNDVQPIRRALVSVYDKQRLDELAAALTKAGVEIVSTGSTARRLTELGADVTEVVQLTGFPECLDGRVKTLHPAVHAGILADRRLQTHRDQLADLGIAPFDLVVSNLYPFSDTVASGASPEECVEQIDIGGPSMVRAAAKNHASVAVVTSPEQYDELQDALAGGGYTLQQRRRLAAEAFAHTADYDVAVAGWMGAELVAGEEGEGRESSGAAGFPRWFGASWRRADVLRYGENPHQRAALYRQPGGGGLAGASQLHGKQMSYNNWVDTDAARRAANDFSEPAVAIIKHANPCGIAVADDVAAAHRLAHACDPVSAFGGVIAANREVDLALASQIAEVFTEVVCAPAFADDALDVLTRKKNVRLLLCPDQTRRTGTEMRAISGGLLVQTTDRIDAPGDVPAGWSLACGDPVDDATLADLAFAWRCCRAVKSNAIVLAAGRATVGVGMGQVNRVDSARLAVARAGERAATAVAASDAFFPFPDGLQVLADGGVRAVVQPGGSKRDPDVIAAATEAGIAMFFTGTRHFAH